MLPFLYTLVKYEDNCFFISLYCKKTFTGLYTDFSSLTPYIYKVNQVRSLVLRAYNICSTYINFHNERSCIKSILQMNFSH